MIPGEYVLAEGEIILNEGRRTTTMVVANRGDRPIQVGSHFPQRRYPLQLVHRASWRKICNFPDQRVSLCETA